MANLCLMILKIKIILLFTSVQSFREFIYLAGSEPNLVDYVILDGFDLVGFDSQQQFDNYLKNYQQTNQYELVIVNNRYYIIKRLAN